jgi:signal peptidase
MLAVAAGCAIPLSVYAASGYAITIDDKGADTNRQHIYVHSQAVVSDRLNHVINIRNTAKNDYIVTLIGAEAVRDSILSKKLTFTFSGSEGKTTLRQRDFADFERRVIHVSRSGRNGKVRLFTDVGDLSNRYQGTSCKVRFTFEIVRDSGNDFEYDRGVEYIDRTVTNYVTRGGTPPAPAPSKPKSQKPASEVKPRRLTPPVVAEDDSAPPTVSVAKSWSLLSLIMSAASAVISIIMIYGVYRRRRIISAAKESALKPGEDLRKINLRGAWAEMAAIGFGLITPALWVVLDMPSGHMVLVNEWTLYVGIAFCLHAAGAIMHYRKREKKMDPLNQTDEKIRGKSGGLILNIILMAFVLLVLMILFSIIFLGRENANFFGYKPYILSSESMSPSYEKYAAVVIKKGGYGEVDTGDIIAFRADLVGGKTVFHRVIGVTPEGYITKGDANTVADEQVVNEGTFVGREVWHTNATARIAPIFQNAKSAIYAGAILVFIIVIILLLKTLRRQRR